MRGVGIIPVMLAAPSREWDSLKKPPCVMPFGAAISVWDARPDALSEVSFLLERLSQSAAY